MSDRRGTNNGVRLSEGAQELLGLGADRPRAALPSSEAAKRARRR